MKYYFDPQHLFKFLAHGSYFANCVLFYRPIGTVKSIVDTVISNISWLRLALMGGFF